MRIIIVGVGKVGKVLTGYLVKENHDLVIIDTNPKLVEELVDTFDIRGVVGNGANFNIQLEAEVNKSDVLIATTNSDELNILCCLVAKKNGVVQTIARVRNPEYSDQAEFLNEDLGISMVINPEREAASEISRMLRFPSAIKIDLFANGRAEMVELKVPVKSILIGKSLSDLRDVFNIRFLVCAVERNGSVFIPKGDFVIQENDKIHVTSSLSEINSLFKKLGILKNRSRNVMIIGGGKITYYLAKELKDYNVKVRIIEMDTARCMELCQMIPEATVIEGDGTNQEVLIEEGIKNVDAVVTLTGLDEENIIISLFAETLKVPKVITKINHYTYTNILESVGLDSVISPKMITANLILRYVRSLSDDASQVQTLYKLVDDKIEAAEFHISEETSFTNIELRNLKLKENNLIACIIRHNNVIIPAGDDVIKPKDNVVVVTMDQYLSHFEDILK